MGEHKIKSIVEIRGVEVAAVVSVITRKLRVNRIVWRRTGTPRICLGEAPARMILA